MTLEPKFERKWRGERMQAVSSAQAPPESKNERGPLAKNQASQVKGEMGEQE